HELSVTLITVANKNNKAGAEKYLKKLSKYFKQGAITTKIVVGNDAADIILDEAQKDYDLLVLGATEGNQDRNHLFNPIVDYIVRVSPCPTLVIQAGEIDEKWGVNRILVPTNGSVAAKNAAELAFFIAKSDNNKEVLALHVVVPEERSIYQQDRRQIQKKTRFANEMVRELKMLGEAFGVKTEKLVKEGKSPEQVITEITESNNIDLIVIGTSVRPGSERLYLGPRVENILITAKCPVIVLNT
ncbi:MAG: universal stress protein, partial [Balneolaceae bacterium]